MPAVAPPIYCPHEQKQGKGNCCSYVFSCPTNILYIDLVKLKRGCSKVQRTVEQPLASPVKPNFNCGLSRNLQVL